MTMQIPIDELRQKVIDKFTPNFTKEESAKIADQLIWADMSGLNTMGIIKMAGTEPLQDIKPKSEIKIERDTKLSQLIDAGANPAPLVSSIATDTVIQKAKSHGFGIVGVRNIFSSNGAQSFYVDRIARNGLIGIMCSRSPASTTGFNSIDPLFGTNPIGFSFPTNDKPLVFDMAASAMTFYGLILAKARGEKIPENMAIDKDGNPTLDPSEAINGALLPFDRGHKSSGIAMVVEILSGPLLNSAWVDNKTFEEEWGALFIAIDPELLIDLGDFKNNVSDLISKVKNSRTNDGNDTVRLPGEHSSETYEKSQKSGLVEIDDSIAEKLGWK